MIVYQSAQLIPHPKRSGATSGLASAFEFELNLEHHQPITVFGVMELLCDAVEAESVSTLILETLQTKLGDDSDSMQTRFDQAIAAVNRALRDYTREGHTSWLGRLHAILALTDEKTLMLTHTGKAESYLYRQGRPTAITAGTEASAPSKSLSVFSEAVTGSLKLQDRLLLTTPGLVHQVGYKQLHELVADNSVRGSMTKLGQLLEHHPDTHRIAALAIEVTSADILSQMADATETAIITLGASEGLGERARALAEPTVAQVGSLSKRSGKKLVQFYRTSLLPGLKKLMLSLKTFVLTLYGRLKKR